LSTETREDELLITRDTLRSLVIGIRNFLLPKDSETLRQCLQQIELDIGNDEVIHTQLRLALYVFPHAVQPCLKLQGIKPHWMFTLDDLIRSAVQAAINILSPG
jgi:mitogen-activated protein kinase kinase kinase 5